MGFKWKCPFCNAENTYMGTKEKEANSQCSHCKKKLRIYKYKIVDNQQSSTSTINNDIPVFKSFTDISKEYQQESTRVNRPSTGTVDLSTNHLDYRLLLVAINQYLSAYRNNYERARQSVHPDTSQTIPIYEGILAQKKILEEILNNE